MKRSCIIIILLLLALAPSVNADDEVSPQVTITNNDIAIIGQSFTIDVTITDAYVESSYLEIDLEQTPGWGTIEQGYFDFDTIQFEIELLQVDETLTLTFEAAISNDAAEKDYDIPILFYGKAGECESGCVPFRSSYTAKVTVMDPIRAQEREDLGDSAWDDEAYSLAKKYYEEAMELYNAMSNSQKYSEMNNKAELSQTGLEASQLYDSGNSKFNAGNKKGALVDFQSSREKYATIGNDEKVSELDDLIELCQEDNGGEPTDGEEGGSDNTMILIGAAVLAIIVVAVAIIKYK